MKTKFHETKIFQLYHWLMPRMEVKTLTLFVGIAFLMIYLCYAIFGLAEGDVGMMYLGVALGMVPHAFFGAPVHLLYGVSLRKHFKNSEFNAPHMPNKQLGLVQYELFEKTNARLSNVSGGELSYTACDISIYGLACCSLARMCFVFNHERFALFIIYMSVLTMITMVASNYLLSRKCA